MNNNNNKKTFYLLFFSSFTIVQSLETQILFKSVIISKPV